MSQELRCQEPLPTSATRAAPPEIALSDEDRKALRQAVLALEGPSYVARLSALAGRLIEIKTAERTWITKDVFDLADASVKLSPVDRVHMWAQCAWISHENAPTYGSTWWWRI